MTVRTTTLRTLTLGTLTLTAALLAGCGGSQGAIEQADDAPAPADPTPMLPSLPAPADPTPEIPTTPPLAPEDPATPEDPTSPEDPTLPEDPTSPEDPTEPAPTAQLPAELLDLSSWKLTLPVETSHEGNPDEIHQPELAAFALEPFFGLTTEKDGVVFRAPVEGATTSGSGYPRSELREMTSDGSDEASWSTSSGTHTLEIHQAITHLPEAKAHVVAGQIHDAEDDVIMIRLEGDHLFVEGGGDELATLHANYELGTFFTVKMVASEGRIRVYYDDVLALDLAHDVSGCYFKAGAYTQSNLEKGDVAGAYGEVVIRELHVSHE